MTLEAKKNPWPNDPDSYELLDIIGYGATATVQAALCKPRNEKCALKRINLDKCNVTMDELLKEITVMSQCHHENVVSYYTSFVVRDELWLVIELLRGGSLLDEIKRITRTQDCRNGVLDEVLIATILKEVLKGVEYFHNNNQIHRDIKAGNILIGEDGVVQIADFGVSSWINTGGNLDRRNIRHTFVGTPCWMAPEVMEQVSGYNAKADIWSFGITAIELATGTAPYYKYPPMKVLMLTLSNDPPTLETAAEDKDQYKNYSKVFRKMIADCLQKDPEKRPTATELLKHPFFKKAKDKRFIYQMLLADRQLPKSLPQSSTTTKQKTTPSLTFGRLHRTETGEWEWSGDEDSADKDTPSKSCPPLKSVATSGLEPADQQATISSGGGSPSPYLLSRDKGPFSSSRDQAESRDETDEDDDEGDVTQRTQRLVLASSRDQDTPAAKSRDVRKAKESIRAQFFDEPLPTEQRHVKGDLSGSLKRGSDNHFNNNPPELILFLALRIRNSKQELNDIKFDFTPGSDTADGVAQELLGAGLIDSSNIKVITENLSKLIAEPVEGKSIVFALGSDGGGPDVVTDPKTLVGYAQLTLLSISYAPPENTKEDKVII